MGGADLAVAGNVPAGAGLGSSAALAVAVALLDASGVERWREGADAGGEGGSWRTTPLAVARACRFAERRFVDADCGVPDQVAAAVSRQGRATLLDCRTLDREYVPVPPDAVGLVVLDTTVRQREAGSGDRRRAHEAGVGRLEHELGRDLGALRDVTPEEFAGVADRLPSPLRERCRHVVTETERVRSAAAHLRDGAYGAAGEVLYRSHRSLRDDYGVGCEELDAAVRVARETPGVLGARLAGAGSGTTVNLVRADRARAAAGELAAGFERATGVEPAAHVVETADGCFVDGGGHDG